MWVNWLSKTVTSIDKFTDYTGRLVAWFTLLMVVLSFVIVVLRYGFNVGWIGMQESVIYFHGLVFMLGAAYTLKENGHVRIDIFYQKLSIQKQAIVDLFGTLFLLFPVCIFIFYISADYVLLSWYIMEKSAEAGGLPLVYLSKSFILLLSFTLLLQGIAELARNILILLQMQPKRAETK